MADVGVVLYQSFEGRGPQVDHIEVFFIELRDLK